MKRWGPLKGPFVQYRGTRILSRRSRRGCGPVAWARRPRPWLWQSCAWRARCKWPRHGHVLQEHLQHPASLLIDEPGDALHTTTLSQAPNGELCNTLDVISKNFAVALAPPFAWTLSAFAATRHRKSPESRKSPTSGPAMPLYTSDGGPNWAWRKKEAGSYALSGGGN